MLITALVRRQQAKGLNDTEFAALLGIDRTYWQKVRDGRRRPGTKFLQAVMRQFPDLQAETLIFLRPDGTTSTVNGAKAPQPTHGGQGTPRAADQVAGGVAPAESPRGAPVCPNRSIK